MKNQPAISIIVPVFNAEKYIKRCFDCVLAQTFTNWELILVNDGSTDDSQRICLEIESREDRLTLITQQNQGASVARRVGIENAKGDYLVFIDCDDFVETNFLATLYNAITSLQTNIAACGIVKHKEEEVVAIPDIVNPILIESNELLSRFFKYEFWGYVDKIYHKSVFKEVYFPTYTINEDYVVMLQLFHKEERIAYVETPLYHYYIHPNSLSNQKISKRAIDEFYNKLWAYNYCKDNMGKYANHAEAQVAESCIKLIRMIRESDSQIEFRDSYKEMKRFLWKNILTIITSQHMVIGLKLMAVRSVF